MAYPQAPWTLEGRAVYTLHLVNIAAVRPFIPADLEIVSIFPGFSLGSVYFSAYEAGSVLAYNELIVAPAFVRHAGEIGGWITHIYVDNPDSQAGGREIWGLPKELADFQWQHGKETSVVASQGDRQLCRLSYKQPLFRCSQKLQGPVISKLESNIMQFSGNFSGRMGIVGANLDIAAESPFADVKVGKPVLAISMEQMQFLAGAPEVIG